MTLPVEYEANFGEVKLNKDPAGRVDLVEPFIIERGSAVYVPGYTTVGIKEEAVLREIRKSGVQNGLPVKIAGPGVDAQHFSLTRELREYPSVQIDSVSYWLQNKYWNWCRERGGSR